MRNLDELGRVRHWILEIHLVDRAGAFGGCYGVCSKVTTMWLLTCAPRLVIGHAGGVFVVAPFQPAHSEIGSRNLG